MESIFRLVRQCIESGDYDLLDGLTIAKPEHFNWMTEIFEGIHVRERPNDRALIWTDGVQNLYYNFADLSRLANQMLNLFRRHGVEQGDLVFTQLPLSPVNWTSWLAAIKGGLIIVPAATILPIRDLVYRFEKTPPQVILADMENALKLDQAQQQCGLKIKLKLLVSGNLPGWHSLSETEVESELAEPAKTGADEPLFHFFTSGTTGMPKAVVHTHFSYPVGHLATAAWIGLYSTDLHYNISQAGWAKFAWSSFFAPWNMGACVLAFQASGRFQAKEQLRQMEIHKVTSFCAPPTAYRMMILEDLNVYQWHLKNCVSAGEPLNPEIIETWKKGTGISIRDGYGQTESSCLIANFPHRPLKPGSMGQASFLYKASIADEQGNTLAEGLEGHIVVQTSGTRPNFLFKEYLDNPEKTRACFKHGYYYTGDKAYRDSEGYFWFVGRDDDVIKTSDYRVGPFEIESLLLEHESVAESAVIGSPHPLKGFEVKAFILLAPGYQPSRELADALFAFSRKNLAAYKIPRIIQFVEELPKTISGKIRRMELRELESRNKEKKEIAENEYFISSAKS